MLLKVVGISVHAVNLSSLYELSIFGGQLNLAAAVQAAKTV